MEVGVPDEEPPQAASTIVKTQAMKTVKGLWEVRPTD